MLSLFEQFSNNRLIKSVRKNVMSSTPAKAIGTIIRFAKSEDILKAADEKIVSGLKGMGLITREESLALERRIIQLEARLNVLEHGGQIQANAKRAEKARAPSKPAVSKAKAGSEPGTRTIRDAEASA